MWSKRCIVWLKVRKTDASQKFYKTEFVYFIYKVMENWLYDFVSWWRNSDTIIHGTCTVSVYKCIYLFIQEKVVLVFFLQKNYFSVFYSPKYQKESIVRS